MNIRPETFRWHHFIFDVSKINEDIRLGFLSGKTVSLPRPTIEWFSESILGLENRNARLITQVPPIDADYAKALAAPRVNEAILLTQISRIIGDTNELSAGLDVPGALRYDPFSGRILKPEDLATADIVVIDGNHRLASAYYQSKQSLRGILLPYSKASKYLTNQHYQS